MDNQADPSIINGNCPYRSIRIVFAVTFTLSIALNALFLILIHWRSSESLKSYRIVLVVSSISSIVATTVLSSCIIRPYIVQDDKFTMAFDGPLAYFVYWVFPTKTSLLYISGLTDFCVIFVYSYNCIPFIYRYLQICRNHSVSKCEFFAMLSALLMLSGVSAGCNVWLAKMNVQANFPEEYHWNETRDCLPLVPGVDETTRVNNNLFLFLTTVFLACTILLTSTLVISICSAWKIHRYLHEQKDLPAIQRQHGQITFALIVQAISPVCVVGITNVANEITDFTHYRHNFLMSMATFAITLMPCLNPFLNICFIGCYRKAVFDALSNVGKRIWSTNFRTGTVFPS